jgi:hypothetical protein
LLQVDHVRFSEYAASASDRRSPGRTRSHLRKLFQRQFQPVRLLFKEGSGAGGAQPIAREIDNGLLLIPAQ